jgi:hypothetical protein
VSDVLDEGPFLHDTNADMRVVDLLAEYDELQQVAEKKHLPMSTMARTWLLDRLDTEPRVG